MKATTEQTIIGENRAEDFIGRSTELERLALHARGLGSAKGAVILSRPLAGCSELLRQVYDRLFIGGGDLIPIYFAVRKSDGTATQAALRFLRELLVQTVAFRRGDPDIIRASPAIEEISELAAPADGYWIDRLIEAYTRGPAAGTRALVRGCLSAPLRARSSDAGMFVMIDDLHECSHLENGDAFLEDLIDIFSHADLPFVLAGHRRYLFGKTSFESISLDHLDFETTGRLSERLAARFNVPVNDQTRDLLAVQTGGNPAFLNFLFVAAQEKGESLDSFQSVQRVFTDEIVGGRIRKYFDALFDEVVGDVSLRSQFLRLVSNILVNGFNGATTEFCLEHSGLSGAEFERAAAIANQYEIVGLGANTIRVTTENIVLGDYLDARIRLELKQETRALAVGETLSHLIKRAPQLMARFYRQRSSLGLRELMQAFDGQQIAKPLIDYTRFKDEFKGALDDKVLKAARDDNDKISLPQIVYTAHTAAFYRQIGELFDAERSAVALGFAENAESRETVWIAAEVDSKLEAGRALAEFWCDRLEMVVASCGFEDYRLWLVAPEGFDQEAMEVLTERNAFGSSRKQVELLVQFLNVKDLVPTSGDDEEYEIVVPMGDETEMISANTVEEIAKRHAFPAKTINQIKTALVEACINAAEHSLSPDRKIYQKFALTDDKITITVSNRGLRLADKGLREAAQDEGRRGWGMKLIKGLMDDVRVEQTDDGTRITMVKFLKQA